eukprot:CAMPEP_0203667762 /NCGR_PEP_ID=MMETSP0090-20130426/4540_1 /ASSEMBLY_ACC=CAM_ASM_001088 /TAXON_ID=426623 /ORGANISM="Chaetoceros affinis, Strain CCMP159" /LENGTH=826 /DNA_ID=CAMNT_0050532027 /DNA_START=67 /DNA_END=2547 /DNA_ORIENTATION=+
MSSPVLPLTLAFIGISLFIKVISEKIAFFLKSNIKYRVLDFLADYIHYGNDIGIKSSLSLDSPTSDVLKRREKGQSYLSSKLSSLASDSRGETLKSKLVDCRFALAKVCMPLMRELEFPTNRNFLIELTNRPQQKDQNLQPAPEEEKKDQIENNEKGDAGQHAGNSDVSSAGMFIVHSDQVKDLMYIGNDAVHTLGIQSFHAPIQEEINRRMSLLNNNGNDKDKNNNDNNAEASRLRFAPIALNPEIEKNADLILGLTGMDQVRYSLSGSEAMDAAFKDIRASCRNKKVIVRFSSAYHGHVSGVDYLNCGPDHIFLEECSQQSIDFIEKYHFRIAAVVVNPMQHFTGVNKASPPGEKLTLTSRVRQAVPKDVYAKWLHDLQDKCNYCTKYLSKVALVLDDIYFAFRTPELFSMKYFTHPETGAALKPNVVVLGKGIAAGYPLSMVLGQKGFLNTYDKKFLLQVNKTVGTLSAWYGGIVASNVYLESIVKGSFIKTSVKDQLLTMVSKFDQFTLDLNAKFAAENLPIRIRSFSNTFSIDYLNKSLYNSRYPQYLMAEGLYLGNYSTGKFNLNADTTKADLDVLGDKFVTAGIKMDKDGFFEPMTSSAKRKLFCQLAVRFSSIMMKQFYDQIMKDKHIDIEVSHNHPVNKFGHFWSSVFMILVAYPYIFMFGEPLKGCIWFFLTHVVRQSGHFFYEHQDRDIEKLKFGHKDASKKEAAAALAVAFAIYQYRDQVWDYISRYVTISLSIDQYASLVALFTVIPHYVEISYQFGYTRGISWLLKIITDPFTDLLDFYTHAVIHPKWFLDFKEQKAKYKLDLKTKLISKVN